MLKIDAKGFTLIEIAMVLIIVGLLLTMGLTLFGTLTKRAKIIESREAVKQAKEAVLGYAVKNGYLPATLEAAGARKLDSWTRDIQYSTAVEIDGTPSTENACSVNTTTMTVFECTNAACTAANTKSNIAFIVYSKGEDANGTGTITQPTGGPACPSGTCFWIREQATSYTDGSATYEYDDIVQYVSLDEIRSLRECPQQLRIISPNALDQGEEDSFYSYSIQAVGGAPPYTWGDGSAPTELTSKGLSLSTSGLISGTLNYNSSSSTGELASCTETISIPVGELKVTDSGNGSCIGTNNCTSTDPFTISVRPKPLKITNTELPSTTVGTVNANFADLDGTGGKCTGTGNCNTSYSWSLSGNPAWLSVTTSTGVLSVNNPTTAGTYSFTATLSDGCTGSTVSKGFSITVNAAAAAGTPTCSLSANPSSMQTAGTTVFSWSINNGPANGTWSPAPGGTCSNFSSSSGGSCTTGTISATTTFTLTVTNAQGSSNCSATVTVGTPPGPAPSCTLEASPNPITTGNPTSLIWTINNGPATATFSPTSGACTSFSNSYGGNCNTGNINSNTTFQLSATNTNGTGLCSTTVYTTSQDYCSSVTVRNDPSGSSIYVKGGQYGTTCTRVRTNRTFSVNQSDTTAVTLWQNSSCTTHNQNIDSIAYSSGGSITADAYVISADGNKNCAVAINDTDTDTWTLVDE